MPPLADLQRGMARAILSGDSQALAPLAHGLLAHGPIPAETAFAVHRDTVLGGLASALRLTFPTVDKLVGVAFFDQMVCAYVETRPPRRARLSDYGERFPQFLETYPHVNHLPYLGNVAALDLAIDQALQGPDASVRRCVAIEPAISLTLPEALTTLSLSYPADLIRAALEEEDDQALGAIDLSPRPRFIALWRSGRLAVVRALSAPAGRFLTQILGEAMADQALAAALTAAPLEQALAAIQAEVFAASFAQIIQTGLEGQLP